MPITIKELLKIEQNCRKKGQWFQWVGQVQNDEGRIVEVRIKSFGFYNQYLLISDTENRDGSEINQCSGHALSKVTDMHNYIRNRINLAGLVRN